MLLKRYYTERNMSQENKQSKSNMEKGDGQRKGPKFNIYWIYGIIAIVLLLAQVMNFSPEIKGITEKERSCFCSWIK